MKHPKRHRREDDDRSVPRLEPLVRLGDPTEANVLVAMLRSEGIPVRVHGEAFGPYPVAVGELAQVEVWVDADHLEAARAVLEAFRA